MTTKQNDKVSEVFSCARKLYRDVSSNASFAVQRQSIININVIYSKAVEERT